MILGWGMRLRTIFGMVVDIDIAIAISISISISAGHTPRYIR